MWKVYELTIIFFVKIECIYVFHFEWIKKESMTHRSFVHIIELIEWALYHGLLNHMLLHHWLLNHGLLYHRLLYLWLLIELCLLHHELLHLWCHLLHNLGLHNLWLRLLSNTNWLYSLLLWLYSFLYLVLFFKLLDHIIFIPL